MMANATRDPLFLAALTVAEQDAPGAGAYCLRCHTPQGVREGSTPPGVGAALDARRQAGRRLRGLPPIDRSRRSLCPPSRYEDVMIAGIAALDAQAPYVGNARLFWDPRDVRHGPYDDADSPAHAAAGNRWTSSSELCGQCHEVLSPLRNLLDAAGMDTRVPVPARQHVHRVGGVRLRARGHDAVVRRVPHAAGARRRAPRVDVSVGAAAHQSAHAPVRRRQRMGARRGEAGGTGDRDRARARRSTRRRRPCGRCLRARCGSM